jgi:hypothetical protein
VQGDLGHTRSGEACNIAGRTLSCEVGVVYLICYDSEGRKDGTTFISHLKRVCPGCTRIMGSEYLIQSDAPALSLLMDLARHVAPDERVVVSEVTQNVAWHNLKIGEAAMEEWESRARECGETA